MARVELTADTVNAIKTYLEAYTSTSGETIPDGFVDLSLDMLVSKYISVRHFPPHFTEEEIAKDTESYFVENAGRIASLVPIVYGRIGMESETSHTENQTTHSFTNGDPLYGVFDGVPRFARCL